jgi:hypothetical protein
MDSAINIACSGCDKPVPLTAIRRSIDEQKNLRCSCGVRRAWSSLIDPGPEKPAQEEPAVRVPCAAPQPLERPDDSATIADGKAYIESRLIEGVNCPCCGRNNQRYTRPLDAGMARGLVALVRASPNGEVVHVKDIPEMLVDGSSWTSHDFAKARYWGLCEEVTGDDIPEDVMKGKKGRKRRKGFWRSTELGRKFVYSMAKVPKYISLVNNVFERAHGDDWSIQDALGEPFDYYEVTKTPRPAEDA